MSNIVIKKVTLIDGNSGSRESFIEAENYLIRFPKKSSNFSKITYDISDIKDIKVIFSKLTLGLNELKELSDAFENDKTVTEKITFIAPNVSDSKTRKKYELKSESGDYYISKSGKAYIKSANSLITELVTRKLITKKLTKGSSWTPQHVFLYNGSSLGVNTRYKSELKQFINSLIEFIDELYKIK